MIESNTTISKYKANNVMLSINHQILSGKITNNYLGPKARIKNGYYLKKYDVNAMYSILFTFFFAVYFTEI